MSAVNGDWPTPKPISPLDWLVVGLNLFTAALNALRGEWHEAILGALIALLYWAWSFARREAEFLRDIISHAAERH